MNIEEVRNYALSLDGVTEDLFAKEWLSFRIEGRWFMLMQLDAPLPRIAVKLPPEKGAALREEYDGVCPAYHMNKRHWNDLYLDRLSDAFIKTHIAESYRLVISRLPKQIRIKYG